MTRPGGKVTSRLGSKQTCSVLVCVTPVLWLQCCWRFNRTEKATLLHSFSISWKSLPNEALGLCSETLLCVVSFFTHSLELQRALFILVVRMRSCLWSVRSAVCHGGEREFRSCPYSSVSSSVMEEMSGIHTRR